jgi:hypothetical protein
MGRKLAARFLLRNPVKEMKQTPPHKITPKGEEFDFQRHLPPDMEIFTIPFLMRWFNTGPQHWINLVDSGELLAVDLRSPGTKKHMLRIPRAELISYLRKKTL